MKFKISKDQIKKFIHEVFHDTPYGTETTVKLSDIVIPYEWRSPQSRPSNAKMIARRLFFKKYGRVDKPIEVKEVSRKDKPPILLLVDGLTRVQCLRDFGVDTAPIKYIRQ